VRLELELLEERQFGGRMLILRHGVRKAARSEFLR
jgi:hypothetical protein